MANKIFNSFLISLIAILMLAHSAMAGIEFELENSGNIVRVLAVSSEDFAPPLNMTASAQVTFRVPTGTVISSTDSGQGDAVANLNGSWNLNSRSNAPLENNAYDYLSVGLTSLGTTAIIYRAHVPVPLFEFEVYNCLGSIELIDNESDPFNQMPNSANSNPGNQIAVLGDGGDNSWVNSRAGSSTSCTE